MCEEEGMGLWVSNLFVLLKYLIGEEFECLYAGKIMARSGQDMIEGRMGLGRMR